MIMLQTRIELQLVGEDVVRTVLAKAMSAIRSREFLHGADHEPSYPRVLGRASWRPSECMQIRWPDLGDH